MALEHVLDEALRKVLVGDSGMRRLPILENHIIHYIEGRDQFGASALREQWLLGICDFDDKEGSRRTGLSQKLDVLRQQWIEMAGYPARVLMLQPLLDFVERNDFRSLLFL